MERQISAACLHGQDSCPRAARLLQPSEPSRGFARPRHKSAGSPSVVFYLIFFFFLSSRSCSRESFALYSNTSLNRQEAAPISVRCVYHLSPGILIYTAVKNLAPNIFHFEPRRRGCAKGLTVLIPLFRFGGCARGRRTWERKNPKCGVRVLNHVSPGLHG